MSITRSSTRSSATRPVRRRSTALLLTAALAGAASGAVVSSTADAAVAQQQASVKRLEASLTSSGDPDGSGDASFRLNKARGRVCANVTWENIEQPNAAHIHRRSDGGVVVDLTGSVTGGAHCATGVSHRLIARILKHPKRYYFNVHNATYPAGAIQGTLHR